MRARAIIGAVSLALAPSVFAADLQPAATGAYRGSPAAPVMKQFAKTKAESGGGS